MAKLRAHGFELARVSLEATREAKDHFETCWERVTLSFRSDGHIMKKLTVEWPPNKMGGTQRHCYGWKLWKRFQKHVDLSVAVPRQVEKLKAKGWTVESQQSTNLPTSRTKSQLKWRSW